MRLAAGARLGTYEVIAPLGSGGMGEVYRAQDLTLKRDVALKIVNRELCLSPHSRARLQREARALATLSHPHIAAVHDFGESDSGCYIVMEYVAGEPLNAVLARERLRVPAALRIAVQVASALEAAHDKGLIHRDLKPANVRLTPDRVAKVLDFGLAREAPDQDVETIHDSTPISHPGLVVGTPAYMSPEQARGQTVDRRTDIWSFGCVLFELLTSKQAFCGPSTTDLLVAVIERDPDWSLLPPDTPPIVRRLVRRCLEKDLSRRLRDIGDARLDLEEATGPEASTPAAAQGVAVHGRRAWTIASMILAAGVLAGLLLAQTWLAPAETLPASGPPASFVVPLPADTRFVLTDFPALAVSPDGTMVAYTASRGERTLLFIRPLNGLEATPLPGSSDAVAPFFSPDSQWVAFFADGKLKKVPVSGGSAVTICDAATGFGGTWSADDTIVFAPAPGSPLWRVPAAGGTPVRLTQLQAERGEFSHRWPEFLSDGKTVIFTVGREGSFDDALIAAASIDSGEHRVLVEGGTHPRFLPPGHLLYARHGAAWVVPFDAERLQVSGTPVSVLDDVLVSFDGASQLSVSPRGTLAYIAGSAYESPRRLLALDVTRVAAPLAAPARAYSGPRISPDGRKVALTVAGTAEEVWVYDIASGALEQLTFESINRAPIWTPDGKRITFSSNRAGPLNLFVMNADGTTAPERLTTSDNLQLAGSWSPDGSLLAYVEHHSQTGRDIWLMPGQRGGPPRVFANSTFDETAPAFSPDGSWIAYVSNETGRNEVYIRPVSSPAPAAMISTAGGSEPVWSRDGRELFYREGHRLMASSISVRPTVRSAGSRVVYDGPFEQGTADRANYDVGLGAQFVILEGSGERAAPGAFHVRLNWFVSDGTR